MAGGGLGAGGVAELLLSMAQSGRTGVLELETPTGSRKLVVAEGQVVYVTSSMKQEKLALRLVARGLVDKDRMVEAGRAGGDLRAALMGLRAVSREDYDAELRSLVSEVVVATFAETQGTWSWADIEGGKDGEGFERLGGMLEGNPLGPILWNAARRAPFLFIQGFLGALKHRVRRIGTDDLLAGLRDLTSEEGFVVTRIDGYGSIEDLVALSPLGFEASLRLLVGLICVGLAEVDGRPRVMLPRPEKGRTSSRPRSKPPLKAAPSPSPAAGAPAASPTAAASAAVGAGASGDPAARRPMPADRENPVAAARELLLELEGATHHAVLGVSSRADADEIRRAYYTMARGCHPDRFGRQLSVEERQVVEGLFARISEAFGVLSDPDRRREYEERLRSGALARERADKGPVDPKDLARESFNKGRTLITLGEKARGVSFLEHAVEVDRDNWEYRMTVARLYMEDPRIRRKAEPHLQEAIRIDETKPEAHLQLGLLYKSANLRSRALAQFRKGLSWDPGHQGIKAELRALEAEAGEERGEGGILGGILRKRT